MRMAPSGARSDGWGLEEEERLFGDFVAELGGVVAVVAADAEDLGRGDGGEEAEVGEGWLEVRGGAIGKERAARSSSGASMGATAQRTSLALFDVGVAGDGGSVFGGEEFAVAHGFSGLSSGSPALRCWEGIGCRRRRWR